MPSRNYLQKARAENIAIIQSWIREMRSKGEYSVDALIRKAMLVLGCSKRKAVEYLELIEE